MVTQKDLLDSRSTNASKQADDALEKLSKGRPVVPSVIPTQKTSLVPEANPDSLSSMMASLKAPHKTSIHHALFSFFLSR